MEKIVGNTLKEILALRAENGKEATPEALHADLAKSKAKWTLEVKPRYRRAGRSPVYISGKYLTAAGMCPATGEADGQERKLKTAGKLNGAGSKNVDETEFYKILHRKGFAVKLSQNLLNGELETELPPAISELGLKFGAITGNASDVHVTQTSPQVYVSMTFDKFLALTGIKPDSPSLSPTPPSSQ